MGSLFELGLVVMKTGKTVLANTPSLYVVATPLGNLNDIGSRALELLASVDLVAAEDTRHSQRLLDAFDIRVRMLPAHEHNEQSAASTILTVLGEGGHVALISDAGTPCISDPGARVVSRVRAAGFAVVPVPGPCAAVAALSVSGFTETGFHFVGFLPARSAGRRASLAEFVSISAPLVVYESPHRVLDCVADMLQVFGGAREVVIARELTKVFEQVVRLPLSEAQAWFEADTNRARGEFVLIVAAAPPVEGLSQEAERVLKLLLAELPLKSAVRMAAEISGAPRNALYERALEWAEKARNE